MRRTFLKNISCQQNITRTIKGQARKLKDNTTNIDVNIDTNPGSCNGCE